MVVVDMIFAVVIIAACIATMIYAIRQANRNNNN